MPEHYFAKRYEIEAGDPVAGRSPMSPARKLVPFAPEPVRSEQVVGRTIAALTDSFGNTGMGGPGYFGLRFDEQEWLVIALWGAGDWLEFDGRMVSDFFHLDWGRPLPWLGQDRDDLSPVVLGQQIAAIDVEPHALGISLSGGGRFSIDPAPARRPLFQGTKEPRRFDPGDDLRPRVFLCPSSELWV